MIAILEPAVADAKKWLRELADCHTDTGWKGTYSILEQVHAGGEVLIRLGLMSRDERREMIRPLAKAVGAEEAWCDT